MGMYDSLKTNKNNSTKVNKTSKGMYDGLKSTYIEPKKVISKPKELPKKSLIDNVSGFLGDFGNDIVKGVKGVASDVSRGDFGKALKTLNTPLVPMSEVRDTKATAVAKNVLNSATLGLINHSGIEETKKKYPISSGIGTLLGYAAPFGAVSKPAGLVAKNISNKLVKTATKGAIEGALIGGAESAIKGKNAKEIAKDTALMAGFGAGGNLAVAGAGKLISKLKPNSNTLAAETVQATSPVKQITKKPNIVTGNLKVTVPKLEQSKEIYNNTMKKATDFYGTNNFVEGIRKIDATRPSNVITKMFDDNTITKNKTKEFLNKLENRTNLSKDDYEILNAFYPELVTKHKIPSPDAGLRVMKRVQQDTGVNILGAQNKLTSAAEQFNLKAMGKNLRETKSNLKPDKFILETPLSKSPIQNDISVKFETGFLPKSLENMTEKDFNIVVGELKKSASNMKYGEGTRQAITRDLEKARQLRGITTRNDRLGFEFNDGSASDVKTLSSTKPIQGNAIINNNGPNVQQAAEAVSNLGDKIIPENRELVISELLKNSDGWKDKNMLALTRETWERNIIDIAGEKDGRKIVDAIFSPIHQNEAARIRFMNTERDKIKALKLNRKESEVVQKLGEGVMSVDEIPAGMDKVKLQNAVNTFREFYDRVLPMANETLKRNGHKEVGQIKNYFPHFEGDDPVLKALGFNLDVSNLPTDINGLSHQFRPTRNWAGNLLRRRGNETTYDAVQGFDKYIESVSKVIHHTDDIKTLRSFNKALRGKYSTPEIQAEIDSIYKNAELSQEAKEAAVEELLGRSNTHLSNAVADLGEYTNVLAGKKDLADRAMERDVGRGIYNISSTALNNVNRNMVAVNPGSWITNFIPLTQSLATTDKGAFTQAMLDTLKSSFKNDGFRDMSTFLTNRHGSDMIDKALITKVGDAASAGMRIVDKFTSNVVTRAKYIENIKKGIPEDIAMKDADTWAAKMLGDRSLGAMPTKFNQRNFFTKLYTSFQLEVNNQISFLAKDLPREYLKDGKNIKSISNLATKYAEVAVYGYLFNLLYKEITGREPAIDPIGAAIGINKDINNPNLTNADRIIKTGKRITNQIPFVGSFLGGGRLPISAALPDVEGLIRGTTSPIKELSKTPMYTLMPFGAGQLRKTIESEAAFNNGGVYNNSGTQMKYPLDKSNTLNRLKGDVFGLSSLKETQNYYNNNEKALSQKQTNYLEKKVDRGYDSKEIYDKFILDRNIEKFKNKISEIRKDKELTREEKTNDIMKLKESLDKLRKQN